MTWRHWNTLKPIPCLLWSLWVCFQLTSSASPWFIQFTAWCTLQIVCTDIYIFTFRRGNFPGFKQELEVCPEMEHHLEIETKLTAINSTSRSLNRHLIPTRSLAQTWQLIFFLTRDITRLFLINSFPGFSFLRSAVVKTRPPGDCGKGVICHSRNVGILRTDRLSASRFLWLFGQSTLAACDWFIVAFGNHRPIVTYAGYSKDPSNPSAETTKMGKMDILSVETLRSIGDWE